MKFRNSPFGKSTTGASILSLKIHHNCAVILSGVWPFSGQTESKDPRLFFATHALNFGRTTLGSVL